MKFTQVDVWLKKTRYDYKDLAEYFNLSKAAVSLWKSRNSVPTKHIPTLTKIMKKRNGLG